MQPTPISGVYFAAAQNAMAFCVSPEDWHRSLFHDTIFQPTVHIHDAGLLGHPYVWKHLEQRPSDTWLEEALRLSVLQPHLRRDTTYQELAIELAESGLNTIDPNAQRVAERLQRCGGTTHTWSASRNFSQAFEAAVRSRFAQKEPGWFSLLKPNEASETLFEFWRDELVSEWRTTWVEEAADISARKGSFLRASELIRLFYEKYGIAVSHNPTIKGLLHALHRHNKEIETKASRFMRLVCDVYTDSFARGINCRASIVNMPSLSALVVLGSSVGAQAVDPESALEIEEHDLGTIRLPTVHEFQEAPEHALQFIRESDPALEYFESLQQWLGSGDQGMTDKLSSSLKKYAEHVCSTIPQLSGRELRKVWARGTSRLLGTFMSGVAGAIVMQNPYALMAPAGGVFSLAIESAHKYSKVRRRRTKAQIERTRIDASTCPAPLDAAVS